MKDREVVDDTSEDGRYTYRLVRGRRPGVGQTLTFVLLNPPLNPSIFDRAAVVRCRKIAQRDGYERATIVYLCALRLDDSRDLPNRPDAVGSENERYLRMALHDAHDGGWPVVCAWGELAPMADVLRFRHLTTQYPGLRLYCLGLNAHGKPRNPMRLRPDVKLERYTLPRVT